MLNQVTIDLPAASIRAYESRAYRVAFFISPFIGPLILALNDIAWGWQLLSAAAAIYIMENIPILFGMIRPGNRKTIFKSDGELVTLCLPDKIEFTLDQVKKLTYFRCTACLFRTTIQINFYNDRHAVIKTGVDHPKFRREMRKLRDYFYNKGEMIQ